MRLLPGEEAGDAAVAVDHRLRLASRRGFGLECEARNVDAALNGAQEARIEFERLAEQRAELGDGGAQRGALLGPQPLVALAREAVADPGGHDARAKGQQRDDDDQPRRTEGTPRLRLRRPDCLKDTCAHQPDAPASAVPGVRDKSSGLMCGQETG